MNTKDVETMIEAVRQVTQRAEQLQEEARRESENKEAGLTVQNLYHAIWSRLGNVTSDLPYIADELDAIAATIEQARAHKKKGGKA